MKLRRGILLITVTMLIVVISLIVFSTVSALSQRSRLGVIEAWKHQALMAANAGLMKAAYEALQNKDFSTVEATLDGKQRYKYSFSEGGGGGGSGSNFVYLDASTSSLSSSNRYINNWKIINSNPSVSYQITHLRINWSGPRVRTLQRIYLGNLATAKWTGSAATGTLIPITPNVNLPAGTTLGSNQLRFNNSMNAFIVNMTVYLNDGSTVSAQIWPASSPTPPTPPGGDPNSIKITGQVVEGSGPVRMRQTIIASLEISSGTLKIKKYNETTDHLMP